MILKKTPVWELQGEHRDTVLPSKLFNYLSIHISIPPYLLYLYTIDYFGGWCPARPIRNTETDFSLPTLSLLFAFTSIFLKSLKIHFLILLLIFCFVLKNMRNNNIIIEEYIKIMNKSKVKTKKLNIINIKRMK